MRRKAHSQTQRMIRDREIGSSGFGEFAAVRSEAQGKFVRFSYPSGAEYRVPTSYLLQWFDQPHYASRKGRYVEAGGKSPWRGKSRLFVTRTRLRDDRHVALVYLSRRFAVEVAWDTVLMACEPRYEHFGGLTAHSRRLVAATFKHE